MLTQALLRVIEAAGGNLRRGGQVSSVVIIAAG